MTIVFVNERKGKERIALNDHSIVVHSTLNITMHS